MPNTIQLIAALAATAVIGGAATVGTSDQGPVEASAEGAVTAETDIATDVNLRPSSDNVAVETGTDVRADMAGHVATRVEHSPAADIAADAVTHADTVTEATLDAGNSDDDDASDTEEKAEVAAVASSKVEATADDNGSAELGAEFDLNANTDATVDTPAMSADVDSSAATSLAIGLNG